jgi:hypothetical protein
MQSHSQRLEKSSFLARHFIGQRKTAARTNQEILLKGAVIRPQTAEVKSVAEIRVAPLAEFAAVAWGRGIDGHPASGFQSVVVRVSRVGSEINNRTRKLMPQHQRRLELNVADPCIQIGVKVGAADPGRFDFDQCLPGSRRRWCGDLFDSDVA